MTGADLAIESQGAQFFNNLVELFYGTRIAKDFAQGILPSPQETPRHAKQPPESSQSSYSGGAGHL